MSGKSKKVRNILALSGGKDSAALAVYLRGKIPDLEYVFMDTGYELPETYEYLQRMRAILGIDIKVIKSEYTFEDWLRLKNYYLPSPQRRWCTETLKIKPYEKYVGNDRAYSYIGIRADEDRDGYISSNNKIIPKYPFVEDGLVYQDVESLLDSSGLGFPAYYSWRSRSGCYFCFFQQKIEWINLYENHKDLFEKAMSFETANKGSFEKFTWCQNESLKDLLERAETIKSEFKKNSLTSKTASNKGKSKKLVDIFSTVESLGDCIVCNV
jgi:hypothetical protein